MKDLTIAGACGLYCGACGIYRMYHDHDVERLARNAQEVFHCRPEQIQCEGCRGPVESRWSPDCEILACASGRGLTFCHECPEFVCEKLSTFSADRRDIPVDNLQRLAVVGLEAWLKEEAARWQCPACHRPVDIYSQTCRACGTALPW